MKTLRTTLVLLTIIIVLNLIGSISTLNAQHPIHIGNEIGPAHIITRGFIDPDHPGFKDSLYFPAWCKSLLNGF